MAVVDAELRTRLKLELDRRARERVRRVRPDFVCATCGIPVDEATPSCRTCARPQGPPRLLARAPGRDSSLEREEPSGRGLPRRCFVPDGNTVIRRC
jgi:hypothetical protein